MQTTHPTPDNNNNQKKIDKRSSSTDSTGKGRKILPATTTKSIYKDTDSSAGKKKSKRRERNEVDYEDYEEEDRSYGRENRHPNHHLLSNSVPSMTSRSRSASPLWKPNKTFVPSSRLTNRFKSPINGVSTNTTTANPPTASAAPSSQQGGYESSLYLREKTGMEHGVCDVCHRPVHDDKESPRRRHHHRHHHSRCSSNTSTAGDDDNTTVVTSCTA